MKREKISVVIPCYNSEQTVSGVVEKTISELKKLGRFDFEFILVNDGSKDGTYGQICGLARRYPNVTGVDLAKNCGQHNAILAGMSYAGGDYILGMDDDGQTDPTQIGKLVEKLDEGYDIVYGKFTNRRHSFLRNLESGLSDLTMRALIRKPRGLKACPMYLIKRFIRDEIVGSKSPHTNLQGLFLRSTDKIANADIKHFARSCGRSGYTLKKLLRLYSSFLNYTVRPIRLILLLGVFFLAGGIVYLMTACALPLTAEHRIYAAVITAVGLILTAMGILGEYLARLFAVVTHEPQYVVRTDTTQNREELKETEQEYYETEIAYTGRG